MKRRKQIRKFLGREVLEIVRIKRVGEKDINRLIADVQFATKVSRKAKLQLD